MPFATGLALALSAVLTAQASTLPITLAGQAAPTPIQMPAAQTVEQYVDTYFADTPILVDVAMCESHFKQYDSTGQVHRGVVNNQDVGVMQINEHYHLATAQKLGLDIYTVQGNLAYAKYLYNKEGLGPWSSSKPCWGKYQNNTDKVAFNQ